MRQYLYGVEAPAEVYAPDRAPLQNEELDMLIEAYYNDVIQEQTPKLSGTGNPNRDFPGRSKPVPGSFKRMSPLGGKEFLNYEGPPLQVIMEVMRDMFDLTSRPIKAVAGAADGWVEGMQAPLRSNADTTSKVVLSMLGMPNAVLKSAQGFIEGLMGERGVAEILHRLGVKNIEERKTPEELAIEQANLEAKLASQGTLGRIVTGVGYEIANHPLEFWSSFLEDPFIAKGGIAASEKALSNVMKFGVKAGKFLEKGLSKENYALFKQFLNESRLPGGGGAKGFLERVKQAPAGFQAAWKRVWAENNPEKIAAITAVGAQTVPLRKLMTKLKELMPHFSPETSQKVQELMKAGKHQEAFNTFLKEANSDTFIRLTKNPFESAIGNTAIRTDNPMMAFIGNTDREAIWKALKKHNAQIGRKEFEMMRLDDVLKNLPEDIGVLGRAAVNGNKLVQDDQVLNILSKNIEQLSPEDFKYLTDKVGTVLLNKKNAPKFYKMLNAPTMNLPSNPLMNPLEYGRLNLMLPVMESIGFGKFYQKVLWAKDAETEWLTHHFGQIAKAAKPLNKMKGRPVDWRMISKEQSERLQKMLNQGGWENAPVVTPELELLKAFRKQYDEIFKDLGLPADKYRKNFVQHMKDMMAGELDDAKPWNVGGRTTDVKESIRESFKGARQGEDWFIPDAFDSFQTYAKMVARAKFRNPVYEKLTAELNAMNLKPAVKDFIMEVLNDYRGARVKSTIADTMAAGFMKSPLAKLLNISGPQARTAAMDGMDSLVQLGYLTGMGANFKLPLQNLSQQALIIPKTGFKSWVDAQKYSKMLVMEQITDTGKALDSLGPIVKGFNSDPEYLAMKRILKMNEKYRHSGNLGEILTSDPHRHGKIFPTPLESISQKAIGVTGFPHSEADNVTVSVLSGIIDAMKRKGVKSFQALEKNPQTLRDSLDMGNKLALDTMGHFNREFRPMWARHDIGRFLYQYGSFGMLMANLAMKDMQHMPLFFNTLGQQAALATALTISGLSGNDYAAYTQALGPLRNFAALGGEDSSKAVKSPALKAGIGAVQYGYGSANRLMGGSGKDLQKRGIKNIKRSFSSAGYNNLMEAVRMKDPSRIFLKKQWPKRKKK